MNQPTDRKNSHKSSTMSLAYDLRYVVAATIGWTIIFGFTRGMTIFLNDLSLIFDENEAVVSILFVAVLSGFAVSTMLSKLVFDRFPMKLVSYISSFVSVLCFIIGVYLVRLRSIYPLIVQSVKIGAGN